VRTCRQLGFEVATTPLGVAQHAAELRSACVLVRARCRSRRTESLELPTWAHERERNGAGDAEPRDNRDPDEHRADTFHARGERRRLELAFVAFPVGRHLELGLEMGFEADAVELGLADGFEAGLLFALATIFEHRSFAGFRRQTSAFGLALALSVRLGFEGRFSLCFCLLALELDLVALEGEQGLE